MPATKSLIQFVLDRRKNLVQKETMKIGSTRVSTEEQNLDLLISGLNEVCCNQIVTDQPQRNVKEAETRAGVSV